MASFDLLTVGKPTEVSSDYWIWAENKTDKNNREPDRLNSKCGKWLIFEPHETIDAVWENVKSAMEKGDLGFRAKVSTMKDKAERGSGFVICVYTYDWTDKEDVDRVRKALRDLGLQKKLPYKTDEDTIAGNYAGQGKRVSKYYY